MATTTTRKDRLIVDLVQAGTYYGKILKAISEVKDDKCTLILVCSLKICKEKDQNGDYYNVESYLRNYYNEVLDEKFQPLQQQEIVRVFAKCLGKTVEEVSENILPKGFPHGTCCKFYDACAEYFNSVLATIDYRSNSFSFTTRVSEKNGKIYPIRGDNWINRASWSEFVLYSYSDIINGLTPFKLKEGSVVSDVPAATSSAPAAPAAPAASSKKGKDLSKEPVYVEFADDDLPF